MTKSNFGKTQRFILIGRLIM